MQKSFEIRHPRVREYDSLKALWLKCFDDSADVVERFFEYGVTPENVIGAFTDNKAVSVLYMVESEIANNGVSYKALYIYAVCTDPDYRGKGLMKKCFDFLFGLAKERGVDYLFLVPADAGLFDMYEKLGFRNGFCCSEKSVCSADYQGEKQSFETLVFDEYKAIRHNATNVTLASLSKSGFKGFLSPGSDRVRAIRVDNSYAVYEIEEDSVIVHELFGNEKEVLKIIFDLTKADSLTIRGVAYEGNSRPFGMWLPLGDVPVIEDAFFGIPYGG